MTAASRAASTAAGRHLLHDRPAEQEDDYARRPHHLRAAAHGASARRGRTPGGAGSSRRKLIGIAAAGIAATSAASKGSKPSMRGTATRDDQRADADGRAEHERGQRAAIRRAGWRAPPAARSRPSRLSIIHSHATLSVTPPMSSADASNRQRHKLANGDRDGQHQRGVGEPVPVTHRRGNHRNRPNRPGRGEERRDGRDVACPRIAKQPRGRRHQGSGERTAQNDEEPAEIGSADQRKTTPPSRANTRPRGQQAEDESEISAARIVLTRQSRPEREFAVELGRSRPTKPASAPSMAASSRARA